MGVKLIYHFLELARRRRAQVARLRREEAKRVIAPVTAQALVHQIAVVDKGMDGQKLRTVMPSERRYTGTFGQARPAKVPRSASGTNG